MKNKLIANALCQSDSLILAGASILPSQSTNPKQRLFNALVSYMSDEELLKQLPELIKAIFLDGGIKEARIISNRLGYNNIDLMRGQSRPFSYYELSQDHSPITLRFVRLNPYFVSSFPSMKALFECLKDKDTTFSFIHKEKMRQHLKEGNDGLPYSIELAFTNQDRIITKDDFATFMAIFSLKNLFMFIMKGLKKITILSDTEISEYSNDEKVENVDFGDGIEIKVPIRAHDNHPSHSMNVAGELLFLAAQYPTTFSFGNILPEYSSIQDLIDKIPEWIKQVAVDLAHHEHPNNRMIAATLWATPKLELENLLLEEYSGASIFAKENLKVPDSVKALFIQSVQSLLSLRFKELDDIDSYEIVTTYSFLNILFSIAYHQMEASNFEEYIHKRLMPELTENTDDLDAFRNAVIDEIQEIIPKQSIPHEGIIWGSQGGGDVNTFEPNFKKSHIRLLLYGCLPQKLSLEKKMQHFIQFIKDFQIFEKHYHDYFVNEMIADAREFWYMAKVEDPDDSNANPTYWLNCGLKFYESFTEKYGKDLFDEVFGANFCEDFQSSV